MKILSVLALLSYMSSIRNGIGDFVQNNLLSCDHYSGLSIRWGMLSMIAIWIVTSKIQTLIQKRRT
jgi:hypothetical protein